EITARSGEGEAFAAGVEVTGEGADPADGAVDGSQVTVVPTDTDNLAARAARVLAEHVGWTEPVHLSLAKAIPVAAGMAGGSADAAGALVACDALWGTAVEPERLAALAATLGSDVPFPLSGGTALGTGRGEQLTPVLARGEFHWVFALAD